MSDAEKPKLMPETINRHINSVYPAFALLAGMQLDVFTPLGTGPKTASEIATALDLRAEKLEPLLYALVTGGLLSVTGNEFSNTPEANEFLVTTSRRYLGGAHRAYADLWASTMRTADSIRTGVPQAKHDFSAMGEQELRNFIRGLDAGAGATARRLNKSFDLSRFRYLLDAGGGSGGLAIALCELCPELQATVGELSNVAPITRECVAESAVSERVSVVEIDLIKDQPHKEYDAVVLRSVLQVLGAGEAASVVNNVADGLRKGGELFVVGRMLDDSRLSPLDAVAVNVMFLNVYDNGKAYTESEYRAWFEGAGLSNITRTEMAGGYSIMHAVKD
ncbi:MAG: methyltransferase [Gammaproteobacteria bacterium]